MIYLAAVAAATLNLVCSGITTKTDINGSRSEPYSVTYRIDLTHEKWCAGSDDDCRVPEQFADINDAMFQFIRTEKETDSGRFFDVDQVNRETGRHQSLIISGRDAGIRTTKQEGQCEAAPFSGFPKINPKF